MRYDELLRLVGESLLAKMNSRTRQELTSTTGSRIIEYDGVMLRKRLVFLEIDFMRPSEKTSSLKNS